MNTLSRMALPVGLIASILATPVVVAEDATSHDVIIVGAGAAGMEAARVAAADGHSVLIIEAKDYVGGRIRSVTVGQTRLEAGAEEHYLGYETTNAISNNFGNGVYGDGYLGAEVYGLDGGANTCWDGVTPSNEINCSIQGISTYTTVADDFWNETCQSNETLAGWMLRTYGLQEGDRAWHILDASWSGAVYAAEPSNAGCTAQINAGYAWSLSENVRVIVPYNLGYTDAMKTLYWDATLADPNVDHFLSTPVVKIEEIFDGDAYVEVSTATGGVHTAWRVIVTASVGVLQDEIIDFEPDLPNVTVNAYNDIGFDDGFKIAMEFSRDQNGDAFWESEGEIGWMAFDTTVGACWVPTNYKQDYPSQKDAIMMCYPMGDNGTALNNIAIAAGGGAGGEQAVIDEVLSQLDVMFPNQLGQASATHTGNYHVQNWGGEPYTRGVYSFETTTSWQNRGQNNATSRNAIRAPHYGDKLYFAGEHTNRGNGGTVPGARQEGARAANDVDSSGMPGYLPPINGPDTMAPVITLNDGATISIIQFSIFNEPGVTATDDRDGDITSSVQFSGSVNTNIIGSYTLTYDVSDAAGNAATSVTRTVNVSEYVDFVAPVITLNGGDVSLAFEEAYVEQGATAMDNDDGDVTANIQIFGSVDSSIPGTYSINYSAFDAAGNQGTKTRTVTVQGNTMTPDKSMFALGETVVIHYNDGTGGNDWIGIYPADHVVNSGDSSAAEQNLVGWKYTNGSVGTISSWDNYNSPAEGDYKAIMFSNDSYNIYGETAYFSVGVEAGDTTPPVVTLNGTSSITVELFETYNEQGATAIDNIDGALSVSFSGSVNTNTAGTYTLTYTATDSSANSTSVTRTVIVNTGGGDFVEVAFDDFTTWGNWNDGGANANRPNNATYATSGTRSSRIRNGTDESFITTDNFSLAGYSEIQVEFNYLGRGMEDGEEFWLQISTDGGASFQTVKAWARGTDYVSNNVYQFAETIVISSHSLTNLTQLRFRNNGNKNNDRVYLDDVRISTR